MPGRIVVLPEELTNQIAAGEVVERPASIVKELIENSLDAGATEITLEIADGCRSLKLTDNGSGIAKEDCALAFARFATSKIYRFEDIYLVKSFGFRGEALPSIASISRVEMTTRLKESAIGTRVVVEAGTVKSIEDAGCPTGTSIKVTDIFASVPVRRKFLKTDAVEQGHCLEATERLALAHPEVRFKMVASGREVLNIPASKEFRQRIGLVLGAELSSQLLPLDLKREGLHIWGFATRPEYTRANSKGIYIYVNRRYIRDSFLNHAVMTAYRSLIDQKRYPSAVLFIDISSADVDVNVHPAKMEVRFRNPREMYGAVVEALAVSLTGAAAVPQRETPGSYHLPSRGEYLGRVEDALRRYTIHEGKGKLFFPQAQQTRRPDVPSLFAEAPRTEEIPSESFSFTSLSYLGQALGTYLIFSHPRGIILLDQHAAHERVLFEKLRKGTTPGRHVAAQRLLMPEVINVSARQLAVIVELIAPLEETGLEIEPFGGDAIVVKSMPAMLSHLDPKRLVTDLLEDLSEDELPDPTKRRDAMLASLACRGAVKANHDLSEQEVHTLCRDLDEAPFSSTCPHGRPLYIILEEAVLEKMFKRR
ncbi:MAG: DNA mismatch repair endonuclease MutL [Smithellaceae bacterium]|nr:DNA mismatch repair endonuclease MutL [Smithellaceae bacterium]